MISERVRISFYYRAQIPRSYDAYGFWAVIPWKPDTCNTGVRAGEEQTHETSAPLPYGHSLF